MTKDLNRGGRKKWISESSLGVQPLNEDKKKKVNWSESLPLLATGKRLSLLQYI